MTEWGNPDHVELCRITIRRHLTKDGRDLVAIEQDNGDGGPLPVVEALGLLQLAIFDVCNRPAEDDDRPAEDDEEAPGL